MVSNLVAVILVSLTFIVNIRALQLSKRFEYFGERRRLSILGDDSVTNQGKQSEAQQSGGNACVCVFHYQCDRNYNLIVNGEGIIDERIGPNDPPQTPCANPAQICCRVPPGVTVPTSPSPPPATTGAPVTTVTPASTAAPATSPPTTPTPAPTTPTTTTTTAPRTNTTLTPVTSVTAPSLPITLPPGTIIILPTQPIPTGPPPSPIPTGPPPSPIPTVPPPTGTPSTSTSTTTSTTTTTTTTGAPATSPVSPTNPPVTTAAPGTTAANVTTAATRPPIVFPTNGPTTAMTVPPVVLPNTTLPFPVTQPPIVIPPPVTTSSPNTIQPPIVIPPPVTTSSPNLTQPPIVIPPPVTTSRPNITQPPVVIPTIPPLTTTTTSTQPPVVFPTTSPPIVTQPPIVIPPPVTTSRPNITQPPIVIPTIPPPATTTTATQPPVVFPTTPPIAFPTTPSVVFPTNPPGTTTSTTRAPPVTTMTPVTTSSPATTVAPPTTPRPIGIAGSQCGVRYVQPDRQESIDAYTTSFGEFPWMLAVLDSTALSADGTVIRNAFVSGASLISKNYALTGAHRLQNRNVSNLIVRAGEWNTLFANEVLPHQDRSIQKISIHNDFNNRTLFNDIALLKLEEPVVFANNVIPICLPNLNTNFVGQSCVATGWGRNAFGPTGMYQTRMRKVTLPIISRATCQTQLRCTRLGFAFNLHDSFLCAGGQENLDTCTGDGGGPLVCPTTNGAFVQAGIVSWGIGCGMRSVPGVYIDVSLFAGWINSTIDFLNRDTVPR